jgi:photosystem II stability/assembly factor-like uncharacterized protein
MSKHLELLRSDRLEELVKAALFCVGLAFIIGACKKSGGGTGGGTGGWLVGSSGLMVNVQADGITSSYTPSSYETLNGIACRYAGEAWVVGNHGTLMYTDDAGASWQPQMVPTTADLRALATQSSGPVFVAGNGVFLTSLDTGGHWAQVSDGQTNFRSVAAAQDAETVLAVSDDGAVWSFEHQQLVKRTTLTGARAIAVSPDGQIAVAVGDNLIARSTDAGQTWAPLTASEAARYNDVRVDANGQAVAVGAAGAIAHIAFDGSVVMQHIGTAELNTVHIAEIDEDYESVGFTAGEGGQIWITRDGGWSWIEGPNAGQTVFSVDEIGDGHR